MNSLEELFTVDVYEYRGGRCKHYEEFVKTFSYEKLNSMAQKSNKRLSDARRSVDRFMNSMNKLNNRSSKMIQVRNRYEAKILAEYCAKLGVKHEIKESSVSKSGAKTVQNKCKKMTLIMPDDESGCCRGECPCARINVKVENMEVPCIYVVLLE